MRTRLQAAFLGSLLLLPLLALGCSRPGDEAARPASSAPPSAAPQPEAKPSEVTSPPPVSPADEEKALREFRERVKKYAELHKSLAAKLPPLKRKSNAAEIKAHEEALADAIRAARTNAREGDLFSPEIKPVLMRILRSELQGPGSASAKETVREGNPSVEGGHKPVVLKVNARYPDDAPLSTIPPSLLLKLPQLPEQLDYRFVGRHLVLRDTVANLIVDVLPDAVPSA